MSVPIFEPILEKFNGGVNTYAPPTSIGDDEVQYARNMRGTSYGSATGRLGYTKVNSSQVSAHSVTNILNFEWSDNTSSQLITIDDEIRKWVVGTTSFDNLTLPTTIAADAKWDYGVIKDIGILVSDGATPTFNFRWDGTNIKRFGIVAPTSAPSYNTTCDGSLTAGDYKYKLTWRSSVSGCRSAPSDASSTMTAGSTPNDGITINLNVGTIPTTNQNWDQIEVWRTLVGPGGTYYLEDTIEDVDPASPPSTFDSTVADSSLGDPLPDDDGLPPKASIMAIWRNRVWLLNGGYLYYSKFDSDGAQPESFDPLALLTIGEDDGSADVALVPFKESLYLFKENYIYRVYEYLDGSFAHELILGNIIGPKTYKTIAYVSNDTFMIRTKQGGGVIGQSLVYQGIDGQIYAFNGSSLMCVSQLIDKTINGTSGGDDLTQGINLSNIDDACAVYDTITQEYRLSVSHPSYRPSGTYNNMQLVLDTVTGGWWVDTPGRISQSTYPGITVACYSVLHDSTGKPIIWAGESQAYGWVYKLNNGSSDNSGISGAGTSIEYDLWTKYIAYGGSRNSRTNLTRIISREAPNVELYIDLYIDGELGARQVQSKLLQGSSYLWDDSETLWDSAEWSVVSNANILFKWDITKCRGVYHSYRLRSTTGAFDILRIGALVSAKGHTY